MSTAAAIVTAESMLIVAAEVWVSALEADTEAVLTMSSLVPGG
ncbi:hypothetical protein [Aeromicrobium sp. UC242_57]